MADEVESQNELAKRRRRDQKRRMSQAIRQGAAVIVLLVVLLGVYLYWSSVDHAPEPERVTGPRGPMAVNVVAIEPQTVPLEAQYLAQTEASQTVPIRARVSGFLLERAFEEGERIEKGQVLYQIDRQPFEVALAQANAQLAAAQANLSHATLQLERFQDLATQNAATVNELQTWQQQQQVATAEVALQVARVEQAQLDLDYTTIESPIAGVIGESRQDVGSYISLAGDTLLATVRQIDPLYVRYSVSEQDLLTLQRLVTSGTVTDVPMEELKVEIILPDGRIYPFVGRINYVDVAIDPSTGTALVRSIVPNPDAALRPGQFVNVRISGVERLGAILVPQSAVLQSPTGASVYIVDDAGMARMQPVTLGEWYGENWIIESGLEAGDRVIVDHLMQIRPGVSVTVTETDLSPPSTQPVTSAANF